MSRAAFLVCKAAFFGVELLPRLKNAAIGPSSFFFFFFKSYPWLCLKNPSSSLPKVAFYRHGFRLCTNRKLKTFSTLAFISQARSHISLYLSTLHPPSPISNLNPHPPSLRPLAKFPISWLTFQKNKAGDSRQLGRQKGVGSVTTTTPNRPTGLRDSPTPTSTPSSPGMALVLNDFNLSFLF